ncbi:MAG: hypothetical protein U0235_28475 [Polyangiaceae bacterium]
MDGRWPGRPPRERRSGRCEQRSHLLAAPSQTADSAAAKTWWSTFSTSPAFVDATARAAELAGVRVDRARVILVGHSGAGCSEGGGLYAPPRLTIRCRPRSSRIDPCLDGELGRSAARTGRPVVVAARQRVAARPREKRGFTDEGSTEEADRLDMQRLTVPGNDAHNAVVPVAFERFLCPEPRTISRSRPPGDGDDASSGASSG